MGGGCCLGPLRRLPRGGPGRPPHVPLPPHLPLPHRPGHQPRRDGGRRALGALFRGDRDYQGGQRRCRVGDPLPHLRRCPPGAANRAVDLLNTAAAWRPPKCSKAGAWSITCPCDCKVCPLCISVCLLALLTNWAKFARNSYGFRTNECLGRCVNTEVSVKFARISYEFHTNLCEFRPTCVPFALRFANGRCIHALASSSGTSHTLPCLQVPFHAWSPQVQHHARRRFTPHHRVQVPVGESGRAQGSGARRAPTEAPSDHSGASARSERTAGGRNEASSGAGRGRGPGGRW